MPDIDFTEPYGVTVTIPLGDYVAEDAANDEFSLAERWLRTGKVRDWIIAHDLDYDDIFIRSISSTFRTKICNVEFKFEDKLLATQFKILFG